MCSRPSTRQDDIGGDQEFSSLPSWRAVPEVVTVFFIDHLETTKHIPDDHEGLSLVTNDYTSTRRF